MTKILLQDIKFRNPVKYTGDTTVYMTFQRGSGKWEICKENEVVLTGKIDTYTQGFKTQPIKEKNGIFDNFISNHQIFHQLAEFGYTVHSGHKLLKTLSIQENEVNAEIEWNGDWISFLDMTFKIAEFIESTENNELRLISFIERITIDTSLFNHQEGKVCLLTYNKHMGLIWGQGIEILYPSTRHLKKPFQECLIEKKTEFLIPKFTPYQDLNNFTKEKFFEKCLMIVIDNLYKITNEISPKLLVVEILENMTTPNIVNDILRKQNDLEVKKVTVFNDTLLLNTEIEESSDSFSLIFSGSSVFENTLNVLNHSAGGFLILKATKPPPSLVVINSQKIGNENFYFCKTVKKQRKTPLFTLFSDDWKSNIFKSLSQEEDRLNYLVVQCTSLPTIHDILDQCKPIKNSHLIRFVFIDFNLSSFQADKFEDYFKKDLRVNIIMNRIWGTSLLYPLRLSLTTNEINEKSNIYQFNQIKCYDVELHSLGLNLSNWSRREEPVLFEYSGTSHGKAVCGLANLNEGNFYLQPDQDYLWTKPENMSHEEVASVLLIYATAYYILEIESCLKNICSILVHNGLMPLSQAIINLAIRRKLKVFTTYDGKPEHKEYLKNKYPQIHEDNIFNFNTSQMEIPILLSTLGKGVDLIINTSADTRKLRSTLKCLGRNQPRFFQIIMSSMNTEFTIGLSSFLTGSGFHCFYPEAVLALPRQLKKTLGTLISNGLKNGEIQPISCTIISPSALNVDVIPSIVSNDMQKLVVSMREPCILTKRNVLVCESSKSYLIIGDQGDVWLTLLDWLVRRGARKFIIFFSNLSSLAQQKLNSILMIHDHLSISIHTTKKFSFTEDIKSFITGTKDFDEIDTSFIVGKENQEVVGPLTTAFTKARIIVIFNGSGIFLENQNINSRILVIKTSQFYDFSGLLKALDSLIGLPETVIYMKQYKLNEFDTDSSALQHCQHIPTSLQEIECMTKCSKKPFWKELKTSSASYKYCRETSPVFILPSLKKEQMKPLVRSLFHPAFEAVLPSHFENSQELASHLHEEMKKFPCSVFTIICSDWMWKLGLELGILLEKSGKTVSLMLFGISPQWAKPESIKRVYSQAVKDILQNDFEAHNKFELQKGLKIIKDRVCLISNHSPVYGTQFKGLCHLITFTKPTDASLQELTKFCQRNINLCVVNEKDYISMLNSNMTTNFINSNVLFEHKDGAKLMNKDYENVLDCNLSYLEE